jgi:hypothetical protein
MPFLEGFGDMRIAGAKKVRLLGQDESPGDSRDEENDAAAPEGKEAAPEARPRGAGGADAPAEQRQEQIQYPLRKERPRSGLQYLSSTNIFGLTSRSELFYPEAYKPISREHWKSLTPEKRLELIRRQADILEKVGFRESQHLHVAQTAAEVQYEEAVTRRHAAMRRRRKKRGYEGKKQEEEERRKAPLVRRYIARELSFDTSSFFSPGPLDTPIFIPGLSRIKKAAAEKRARPGRRGKDREQRPAPRPKPRPTLPKYSGDVGPSVGVEHYNNPFGLVSRAVSQYPEAYAKVPAMFWRGMSKEHRQQVMQVQATAMEKVGFEPGTWKHFIDDFDPLMENRYGDRTKEDRVAEKPRTPAVIYLGALVVLLGVVIAFSELPAWFSWPLPQWYFSPAAFIICFGVLMMLPWRRDRR